MNTPDQLCACIEKDCSRRLAHRLRDFVTGILGQLEADLLPGLRLPAAEAGHLVRDNARVDLAYVTALLVAQGTAKIGETKLRPLIYKVLQVLDGPGIDGFFSYRLAETARLLGGMDTLPTSAVEVVAEGSAAHPLLRRIAAAEPVRNNFLVVAARCDHERRLLGLDSVGAAVELSSRVTAIFEPAGWISDDSRWPDNFDIYTPEMYLLAQPFADAVGPAWAAGFDRVLDDLSLLCSPRGAVVWGRSIGVLAEAMTIELAALSALRGRHDSAVWMGRAAEALSRFASWFDRGIVTAHRGRTSDPYRGPSRRLQLTLDLLGKLLVSARWLDESGHLRVETRADQLWPDVDRYVRFGPGDSGAWAYRSRELSFVLPVVGGPTAEYAVAPRWPGAFEQPPNGPPTFTPALTMPHSANSDDPVFSTGTGGSVQHHRSALTVTSHGWSSRAGGAVDGMRITEFTVCNGLLVAEELVEAPTSPECAVSLVLASGVGSPVIGSVSGCAEVFTSPVEGVAEWRTPWGAYDLISHVRGRPSSPFSWSAGRGIVVASSDISHPYNQALYAQLPQHVRVVDAGRPSADLAARLRRADVLHLAWPERWAGRTQVSHERVIEAVRDSGVRIVWTMHNLIPHRDRDDIGSAIYSAWASAAHAVIHHTEYGLARAVERYRFTDEVVHEVIPHGHWGHLMARHSTMSRAEVESDEGWGQTGMRLAVVGQPRPEKHLLAIIDAARACRRPDLQFVIRTVPEHHGFATERVRLDHGHLSPERYFRRFAAYDALILPFGDGEMLGTGTVFDGLGAGVAAIGPRWEFLRQVLGDALIEYQPNTLLRLLRNLDTSVIAAGAERVRACRTQFDWAPIGQRTAALFLAQAGISYADLNALAAATPGARAK